MLGPGPSIGAVVSVAGAVGVSLSAAGAATDRYGKVADNYGWVGRLGVTVGAAVGTFLASCAHGGLSKMFVTLCAAVISGGPYLCPLLDVLPTLPTWWTFRLSFRIIIPIILLIWIFFTFTNLFIVAFLYVCFLVLHGLFSAFIICLVSGCCVVSTVIKK